MGPVAITSSELREGAVTASELDTRFEITRRTSISLLLLSQGGMKPRMQDMSGWFANPYQTRIELGRGDNVVGWRARVVGMHCGRNVQTGYSRDKHHSLCPAARQGTAAVLKESDSKGKEGLYSRSCS